MRRPVAAVIPIISLFIAVPAIAGSLEDASSSPWPSKEMVMPNTTSVSCTTKAKACRRIMLNLLNGTA